VYHSQENSLRQRQFVASVALSTTPAFIKSSSESGDMKQFKASLFTRFKRQNQYREQQMALLSAKTRLYISKDYRINIHPITEHISCAKWPPKLWA
jgi:hypothetical protein